MLNLIHFNINSFHNENNKNDFEVFISINKPDFICLSETWSTQTKRCKLYGYNFVEQHRPEGYGGVAIGIANHIQFKKISISCKGEIVAITTLNTEKPLNIVSVYFTPTLDKT